MVRGNLIVLGIVDLVTRVVCSSLGGVSSSIVPGGVEFLSAYRIFSTFFCLSFAVLFSRTMTNFMSLRDMIKSIKDTCPDSHSRLIPTNLLARIACGFGSIVNHCGLMDMVAPAPAPESLSSLYINPLSLAHCPGQFHSIHDPFNSRLPLSTGLPSPFLKSIIHSFPAMNHYRDRRVYDFYEEE